MSFKKIIIVLLVCAVGAFSATVQMTDLVGFNGATPAQDLPAVIKANSGWVPLVQVQVTSDTAVGTEVYKVYSVTFTLDSISGFDASVDFYGAIADSLRVFTDTACTSAVPGTITHKISGQTVTAFAGTDPETIEIEFGTPVNISTNSATSPTFLYVAVKTGNNIADADSFRTIWTNSNEFCVRVSSSGTVNYDIIPAPANGAAMTADIYAPVITANFTPSASDGQTTTVENLDTDNVYKTGDTLVLDIYLQENSVNETAANLRGDAGVVAILDCLEISGAGDILGSLGSATTTFGEVGVGQFRIAYTITDSDVNQNTDGTTPLTFGIKVKDGAGNESSWDTSFKLYIDSKTPEAVSLTDPDNSDYVNTLSPVFSWTESNEAHLKDYAMVVATSSNFGGDLNEATIGKSTTSLNIQANTAVFFNKDFTLNTLVSGTTYYWTIYAGDLAGHAATMATANYPAARSFIYDAQVPETAVFTSPTAGATLRHGSPTITATVGDYGLSGVDSSKINMKIKQGASAYTPVAHTSVYSAVTGSYTVTYTPSTPLADGAYKVKIEAQDLLGNEMALYEHPFNVDKTSPTITDTDNDGESDEYEKNAPTDWLDAADNSGANMLWPVNGQVINAATLAETTITGAANEIRISIDDPYQNYSGAYNSDVDRNASTVTISGVAGTWIFGANGLPYAKASIANDAALGVYATYDTYDCQIPIPLATNGSDDGTYSVTVVAVDGAGNKATIARSFVYDTTLSTVSIVTAPAAVDTGSSFSLAITATDDNGISGDGDAVKVYYLDSAGVLQSSENLAADPAVSGGYTHTKSWASGTDGTYYYYFSAEDKAGNVTYCPAGANFDKSKAIQLTVTDKSGPWVVIANQVLKPGSTSYIKTLVDVPIAAAQISSYTTATSPSVNEIPVVYSASNNKLQATVEDEAVGALFQYKASTSATWISLTTVETVTNTVWEANWDTTGLSKTTYDIRVRAWDVLHNTTTPTSVLSAGWVQVKLAAALAPVAVIDTAKNNTVVSAGGRIRKQAVLCADLSTTVNVDFASVKFQYKAAGGVWTDIATDSDPTANTPTNVTFTFDYADLVEYIQEQDTTNGDVVIDTTQIKAVTFNCTTDNAYDRSMKFYGSSWTVTVPLVPASYDYQFDISFADGSSESFEDMDQQGDGGADSMIIIAPFTAVWNVTGLSGSYEVRVVATDSRGISDSKPTSLALVVDNSAPTSVSITAPADGDRIETGVAKALYAQVTDTADMDNGYVYFMYSLDGGYIWTRIANEDTTDEDWTQNWTPAAYANDINNCLLKAVAVDEAGNIAESASINVILDATDPEILSFEMNSSSSTEIDLNMGTAYNWSVTTLSPDIDNLKITMANYASTCYKWTPSNTVISWTGLGTVANPYRFSGTVLLTEHVSLDNGQEVFTATLEDKSGRQDAVTKNVNYKDVTPNPAAIVAVDGLEVRSGDALVTAGALITVRYRAANTDSGVIYYQYKASASPDWLTFAQDTGVGDSATTQTNTANFPPAGITLSNGSYDLRALAIDDDGNADPSPATVTITVDTSLPIVKPAAVTEISAAGVISMIEYDELVTGGGASEITVEYRVPGSSWTYWAGSTKGAQIGEAGDLWTCDSPFAPVSGTYELRAICVETGGLEQDSSIAPVYTVLVKRDSAGNVIVYKTTAKVMNLALSNVTLGSTYAGTELTATGTLEIKSAQALTNITARLMTTDGVTNVDRYLTVSGSTSPYTASVDMSEIMDADGDVRILVTAIDASGNYVSEDMIIASESSALQPDGVNVNVGRIVDVDFNGDLENASTLIVYQASTSAVPSSQSSIVTALVGEPWEFLLSEPESFQTSNYCTIEFEYRDNELMGGDENKLGIVYWDAVNSKWSSEGITRVKRDIVANTVEFRTNHFSKFQLAVINAAPAVTFVSPASGGMAGNAPIIEADIADGFSAIRQAKIVLDGVDQTAAFAAVAYRDGIDNDGNGLVDEDINAGGATEGALNQVGATSAKYKVRPGLQLGDGSHTLAITATSEQGISTTQSISFTVGGAVGITSAFMAPNPYNPSSGNDAQIKVNMTADANITLKVYDFGGKLVYTSKTNELIGTGGSVFWNGRTNGNKLLANGVYLIRIEADTSQGTDSKVIKAALLR